MNKIIIEHFFNNVWGMVDRALEAIPFAIGVTIVLWLLINGYEHINSKKINNKKIVTIFLLYIACLIHMAILSRPIGSISQIDLIPFNTPGGTRYIILYAAANVVIFVPLGILLPVVFSKMRNMGRSVFTGFILSFIIETCQLILCCGVVQTEDIIMNTLGTAIGYLIYREIVKTQRKLRGDGRGQKRK